MWRILGLVLSSFFLCVALSSCSFLERNTIGLFRADSTQAGFSSGALEPVRSEDKSTLAQVTVKAEPPPALPPSAPGTKVEVIWSIPKDPVEGFIVRYGFTKSDLRFEEKLQSSTLDRFEDPQHGFVYRHVLKNVPTDKPVFVSLTAYTGTEQSAASPVFEVAPTRSNS